MSTATPSQKFILCAVDGTLSYGEAYMGNRALNSINYTSPNRSYVQRFYDSFKGPKLFLHGPDVSGAMVTSIYNNARRWLKEELGKESNAEAKIILVGHSRGGHIVIQLARYFNRFPNKRPIHFMGLYDAVDRNLDLHDFSSSIEFHLNNLGINNQIPGNVEHLAHAIRSGKIGSRFWFGNTGVSARRVDIRPTWQLQPFDSTHGGLGGAVPEPCELREWKTLEPGSSTLPTLRLNPTIETVRVPVHIATVCLPTPDFYPGQLCHTISTSFDISYPAIDPSIDYGVAPRVVEDVSNNIAGDTCNVSLTAAQVQQGGDQANAWIRSQAKKLNILP